MKFRFPNSFQPIDLMAIISMTIVVENIVGGRYMSIVVFNTLLLIWYFRLRFFN